MGYQDKLKPIATSSALYRTKLRPVVASTPTASPSASAFLPQELANNIGFKKTTDTLANVFAPALTRPDAQKFLRKSTVKEGIGAGMNLASTVIGGVGSVGAKVLGKVFSPKIASVGSRVLGGMLGGFGYDVGQNLEKDAKGANVMAPGVGTAVGAALPLVGPAIGAVGRSTAAVGSKVFKSAITPTVPEAERILDYRAKNPLGTRIKNTIVGKPSAPAPLTRAETAFDSEFQGTQTGIAVQATREQDRLWKEVIAPAVKSSKAVLTKEDLFSPIEKRISDTTEPAKRQAYLDAYDAIKEEYKRFPEHFSLEEGQSLKRGLDEFTPQKMFRGKDVANEYRVLQHDMADAVRGKTYDLLDDKNIKKAYLDYGNMDGLKQLGVKAISESAFQGGMWKGLHGMWDMAATPIKTIGGRTLYRVGNAIEFLAEGNIKTLGEFLSKKGLNKPK